MNFIRIIFLSLVLLPLSVVKASWPFAQPDFLEPDDAFHVSIGTVSSDQVELIFKIAPEYYLYQRSIKVSAKDSTGQIIELPPMSMPAGEEKFDTNFNETLTIFRTHLRLSQAFNTQAPQVMLSISYQGCADAGLCYSPIKKEFTIERPNIQSLASAPTPPVTSPSLISNSDTGIAQLLANQGGVKTIIVFFALGLLLSLTPCVLPMLPILSSLILGDHHKKTKRRGFLMAFSYVLGMSIVYTLAGIMAGLSGASLASSLQTPWVLGGFALLLSVLALGMFDVIHIQLPHSLQTKLNHAVNRLPGGQFVGVFLMGAVSALIVGPCVAAPLAGALLYISQTGHVWLGGVALFAMAWGMGVPLLVLGMSAGAFKLKPGAWMTHIKQLFGVLLLGVAWWMLASLLAMWIQMLGWATLAFFLAVVLGTFDQHPPPVSVGRRLIQVLGLLMISYGFILIFSSLSGGHSLTRPLSHLDSTRPSLERVSFERITSLEALEQRLAIAKQPVILDFYADWCVSCKEMEAFTFPHPSVSPLMKSFTLLQVDVTKNTEADSELLKRFGLFGPPGIIFFNQQGEELTGVRVIGYQDAEDFSDVLRHVLSQP